MENNSQQLELFSRTGKAPEAANIGRDKFFGHIRGYEKIIFIAIGFIVTAVIAFSLGAERGRRLALGVPALIPVIKQEAQPVVPVQEKIADPILSQPGNYTIQLASFKNKTLAQKEAAALRKKGLASLVVTKGSYNIVCVGSFSSKESAKSLLGELRKEYQDSFIRRL